MSHVSESKAIARPTFHHINLKTLRLQEMIDWYATVPGMETQYQFPGGAWLTTMGPTTASRYSSRLC